MQHLMRYRKNVIERNISFAFPGYHSTEVAAIKKDYYRHLSDIILETLAGYGKSAESIKKRLKFSNPEIILDHHIAGRPLIVMGAHLGNWEWPNIAIPEQQAYVMASMTKPISNPYLDKYIQRKRSKTGAKMVSIYGSHRALIQQNDAPWAFVFISDQYPPNQARAVEANFFGRPTKFLHGAQQIAKKKNYPLYGVEIKRVRRGHYVMEVQLLADQSAALTESELTQRYATYLENCIKKQPSNWLWSHKRWKNAVVY